MSSTPITISSASIIDGIANNDTVLFSNRLNISFIADDSLLDDDHRR